MNLAHYPWTDVNDRWDFARFDPDENDLEEFWAEEEDPDRDRDNEEYEIGEAS